MTADRPAAARLDAWDLALAPLLGALSLLLAAVATLSLKWDLAWDLLDMQYVALLINKFGHAPYRDVFDPNTPGTMLFHSLLTRVFGYTDLGTRVFDVLYLAALAAAVAALLRRFDWRARWAAAVIYPLIYLSKGEYYTLQRDHLLALPSVAALLAASAIERRWLRALAAGCCVGAACALKPQAGLLAAPLLAHEWWRGRADSRDWRSAAPTALRATLWLAAGGAAPLLISLAWVAAKGGLPAFLDIAGSWWPLHTKMFYQNGRFIFVEGTAEQWRIRAATLGARLPLLWLWFVTPATLALYRVLRTTAADDARRADALLLLGGAGVYAATVVVVGQAHPYVWLPMGFFLTTLAALGAHRPTEASATKADRAAPLTILLPTLLALFLLAPTSFKAQLRGRAPEPWRGERPREIGAFLKENLRPGDRVQLLDWFGGGSGAAWRAQADSATRFYIDYQFHLHPSAPRTRALQEQFFAQLEQAPPRFVVQTTKDRNEFEQRTAADREAEQAFEARLTAEVLGRYHVAKEGAGYLVWEWGPPGS